ncbi:MAG: TrbI/VirB10 family protein [Roseitalea sp.]|jgi:type IV secretion system protein VirB10|nr:TrbI/VirB10 family protein [Roseitalea sp.]MBO6721075.1 TrbI/VirB10 family protein [Roseitalea sp.]MBO6742853.1 TrbI/VirB10 family protein [Roseitalea sp.]
MPGAFLNAPVDRRTVSEDRLQPPAPPYVVQAGTVIAAALITGIRSDLPGTVTAQVTEHVYDSPTGRHLLVPQGSRLIGEYDSDIAFGQNRVLLVWTRLIYPDGRSIVLERLPATDPGGYAGLQDRVNRHWGRLFLAAGLSTLINVSGALQGDDEDDIARAIRESVQDQGEDIGGRIIDRELDVRPTLTIRPGFPLRIIIQRDLVLTPW